MGPENDEATYSWNGPENLGYRMWNKNKNKNLWWNNKDCEEQWNVIRKCLIAESWFRLHCWKMNSIENLMLTAGGIEPYTVVYIKLYIQHMDQTKISFL